MKTIFIFAVFGGLIVGIVSIERSSTPGAAASPSRSLGIAVDALNARSAAHFAAENQPPLSKEEVIAAINKWQRRVDLSVSSDAASQISQICETGDIPMTARLHKLFASATAEEPSQGTCTILLTVLVERGKPHIVPIRQYLLRELPDTPPAPQFKEAVESLVRESELASSPVTSPVSATECD